MTASNQKMLLAWLIALTGTLGSLYLSDIRGFVPCLLCWYQRIALYPLVVILPIGILRHDTNAAVYTLPLVIIGAGVAFYQNLLVWHLVPASGWCGALGDCANGYINWWGFISIPLLSLATFIFLIILLVMVSRRRLPTEIK